MQAVTTGMREKGIDNVEWIDTNNALIKKDVKTYSVHKYNYYYYYYYRSSGIR